MCKKYSSRMHKLVDIKGLYALNRACCARYSIEDMKSPKVLKNKQSGFTMVELLAVIMVIGILAGMILGIAGIATKKAAKGKAQALFVQIEMGLAEFHAQNRYYPQGATNLYNNLEAYIEVGKDLKKSSAGGFTDPWGREVIYKAPGNKNPETYDLLMTGADGKEYKYEPNLTDDDLKNW